MTNFAALLRLLAGEGVEFILVGGAAATAHGSVRLTRDLDIVYRRTAENLARLVRCLTPHRPYLRGAPPGLPFQFDPDTLQRGLNFTLMTDLGALDLFGEIAGGGRFEDLLPHSIRVTLYGVECLCLGLRRLIEVKRAAGRPRDLEAVAELEALLEEKEKNAGS
jgi:predicted nucleotidyltransferase